MRAEGWYTPLHLALGNGWIDTAYYLLDCGASSTIKNKYGLDPATFAERKGYSDLAKRFRQAIKAKHRETTLQSRLLTTAPRGGDIKTGSRDEFDHSEEDDDDEEERS